VGVDSLLSRCDGWTGGWGGGGRPGGDHVSSTTETATNLEGANRKRASFGELRVWWEGSTTTKPFLALVGLCALRDLALGTAFTSCFAVDGGLSRWAGSVGREQQAGDHHNSSKGSCCTEGGLLGHARTAGISSACRVLTWLIVIQD
jgi:hypothetical protein